MYHIVCVMRVFLISYRENIYCGVFFVVASFDDPCDVLWAHFLFPDVFFCLFLS